MPTAFPFTAKTEQKPSMKKIPFKARLRAAGIPADGIQTVRVEANPDIALEVTTTDQVYYIHLSGIIPPMLETVIRGLQAETDQQRASSIIADTLATSYIGQQVKVTIIREPRQ